MTNDLERLNSWFCEEVLTCEAKLTRFIQRHWRATEEITDIRQEIYERVLIGANREIPRDTQAYLFSVARNHLINRHRRSQIVRFEMISDLENFNPEQDFLTPERHAIARQELQRLQDAINLLPSRCREVIRLRKIYGMSTREVAEQMGVSVNAVEQQTTLGMRALVDFLLGGSGKIKRPPTRRRLRRDGSSL